MVNSLIKLKLLKTSMFGAIAGGIAVIAVASVVTKAMCKKKKKNLKKNDHREFLSLVRYPDIC